MNTIQNIPLTDIVAGRNDRTFFDTNALRDLADSISKHGLAQPITVRELDGELFQIVAGERRFRAFKLLGLEAIPAIVRDLTDTEASAIMLAENVARDDLDPIDEARAYQSRMTGYGWSVDEVAKSAGVTSIRIQFRLKLLALRADLQDMIRKGQLTIGYAQIMSDSGLDVNFQMIAFRQLRDNPRPTLGWFRMIVNGLVSKQNQSIMFDCPLISGECETAVYTEEPAHPATSTPPKVGKTIKQILSNQSAFWQSAADEWGKIGKPFKKQECEAAAKAVQIALTCI